MSESVIEGEGRVERARRVPPRPTSESARKAWATKRAQAEEKRREVVLDRIITRTADHLAERMLEHTSVAVEYAAEVVTDEKRDDKLRLQAAGLLLGQGHAAAPKRIISASLSIRQVLERDDGDVLAAAMAALQGEPSEVLEHQPALAGQGSEVLAQREE